MKSTLLAVALIAMASTSQAITLTQWNFNFGNDASTSTGTTAPNIGVGSAALIGGATATFASGNSGTGSSDPELADDSAWNLTTWAAQGAQSGERGAQFNVSTAGFQDIIVTWDNRHSNTSSRFVQFQYSLDGTSFSSIGLINNGVFEATAGDSWFNGRSVDLTTITGVNDNANFAFRVVSIFDPSGSAYVTSNPSSSYGTTGTIRFDMVTVDAQPVPEPATLAALALGAAALVRRRKSS